MTVSPLRQALCTHLGQTLTPEVAAAIERAASLLPMSKPMVEKVQSLHDSMQGIPPVDCPIKHYFAPGMYAREISIPKGTVVVGAIHKTENLVILSKGRLRIVSDEQTREIEAPCTITCKAGARNAVYAIEDSVWTNFFPTTETDPEKLVEILTFSKSTELLGGVQNAQRIAFEKVQQLED